MPSQIGDDTPQDGTGQKTGYKRTESRKHDVIEKSNGVSDSESPTQYGLGRAGYISRCTLRRGVTGRARGTFVRFLGP